MKKKIILISSAVLLGAVLTTFILMRNKSLGNISVSVPAGEAKTAVSESSFKCCKGDRIRVSLNTNVKSGAVNFVLYNSKGGVVENFGTAKAYRGFVDLELDDTYTLVAEYSGLEGDFKAEVSKRAF
ncbi:MAG: hypothetical protein OSJ54_10095 [Oscillospiraceae bacterium]|nr:hypothetical protein [Oscillospiraceae bacterium]